MDNDIIDTNLQRGFLTGTMEHIFATSTIIQNAICTGLPLSLTFLHVDIKNFVPHQLISDMLAHTVEVRSYSLSTYSQLSARVVTKTWSTPIKRVQAQCTRVIKILLGKLQVLSSCDTIAEYRMKAKIMFLSSVLTSRDPLIAKISELLLTLEFCQHIPPEVNQLFYILTSKTSSQQCRKMHTDTWVKRWKS